MQNNESDKLQPRRGALAICGWGCLGLITMDGKSTVVYKDGNQSEAYIGIHLTNKIASVGSKWTSTNPKVIGYIEDYENYL